MSAIVTNNSLYGGSEMRAIAYVRVSSEEQVHGTSLDSQVKACIEYAERQGVFLDENDIFREEGVSAKIIDRPQLAKMLEFCAKNKGKLHQCIVWKVDRLARRSEYHHIIKAQLAKFGVKLVSVTEPIGDDPTGNLMESMLAAFAQFDNDIRALRTTSGMKARTEQGGWPHDAPYGYAKTRTASGASSVAPDPEAAPIMIRLLEAYATGDYTIKQLAELAYTLGVRNTTGGRRGWQSIKNLIVNPLYAGYVRSKFTQGEYIKGLHEPLIKENTHYRILAIVDGSLKKNSKHSELEWPLRGGFLKHTCGKAVTGGSPRGRNGPSPRYICMGSCKATPDTHLSKRREQVHDDFMEMLSRIRPDEPTQKLFKEVMLKRWNEEYKFAAEHNDRLNREIAICNEKKSRIIDLFIDGKLTEIEKSLKLTEVDKSVAHLKILSIEADKDTTDKEAIIDGALLFMSDPGLFWNLSDISVKRRVQDAIFPDGVVYDFDTGFRTAKLAESYLLMRAISETKAKNPSLVELLCRYSKMTKPIILKQTTAVRSVPAAGRVHLVRKRLSPVLITQLASDYEGGMSSTALTVKYDLAKGTVLNLLREQGAKVRGQGLDEADVPEAAELYRGGWSLKRIANHFDCNHETVRVALKAAGVVMRRPCDRVRPAAIPAIRD